MVDFGDGVRGVVQARTGIFDEHDVVRISLALQEHGAQFVAALVHDVLGQAKAHRHVELAGLAHLGREHLEVVEALRAGAVKRLEVHDAPRLGLHGGAKLERGTHGVRGVEGAVLERHLHPSRRHAARREMRLREIEILLGEHAHSDPLAGGRIAGLQHQAVVAALFQATQVERAGVLVAHHQAEGVDIEGAALFQVAHPEHGVTGTRDGAAGSENRAGYGHVGPSGNAADIPTGNDARQSGKRRPIGCGLLTGC